MKHQPLSGSDYFHLLLDRKMLRNGLVGNISRIHLELSSDSNLHEIAKELAQNPTFQTVSQLKVVHRWPFLPFWEKEKGKRKNVKVRTGLLKSEFNSIILNRKVDNENGLVFIDLCELEDGSKHTVISMHHVLSDHQGMVNFLSALADNSKTFPLFPEVEKTSALQTLRNAAYMTVYMLSRSSGQLGTLANKNLKPKSAPTFKTFEFSEEETKQIEKNAWQAGSRIGQSAFYISATAKVVNQTLYNRNQNPPYLWFSVPNDQRKKGATGHLVSNQLSFLFFRLNSQELSTTETAITSINQQVKAQIKDRITQRYTDLLNSLRLMPMPVYEAMVDLASNGKMSSFGFSDLGTDKINLSEFLGAKIENTFHYQPVPSPPGFNVVVSKANGKLKFVWAYFDEVLTEDEIIRMESSLRNLLLSVS
ncbi:MAG TPA: hypothetical protein DCR04_02065 [Flavobacteriales bacterium]|nr:hypothetical protein [Flavobacteriales bacterium]